MSVYIEVQRKRCIGGEEKLDQGDKKGTRKESEGE